MKKWSLFLSVYLCLCLLAACGAAGGGIPVPSGRTQAPGGAPSDEPQAGGETAQPAAATLLCRLVEEDDGSLLLAEQDGPGVYRVSALGVTPTLDGRPAAETDYEEGMLLEITHSGLILETFPAQLDLLAVNIRSDGFDDRCELYLDVLEDLWEVDEGLNHGITELGVDLSATSLSASEQAAVAWAFGGEHGLAPIQGTWEELADQGYIDRENLLWENGCLFSITEKEMEGTHSLTPVTFDAQKWRSGLGAYYFIDCTALQSAGGEWSDYAVGSEAIS